MAHSVASLSGTTNSLARHYQRFNVAERMLLTGHSHQAWPDIGFEGQQQAWLDAARHVDDKWAYAFERADVVRRGFADLLGDSDPGMYALGANTHELLVRFLSALPVSERPKLITTDGEFHSVRRQFERLAEEPVDVVRIPAEPPETLAERLCQTIDDRTAAVVVSAVMFGTGRIVPGLGHVAERAERHGAQLLIDAYHALDALPYQLKEQRLDAAFVVGGGYKYCQLGEGNCFLRVPRHCELRPVVTGWYAEFDQLESRAPNGVRYPATGSARFAGSTYDPTSHYRAARVFEFFREQELTPTFLRQVSQHQVGLLCVQFEALDADPSVVALLQAPLAERGAFVALFSPLAAALYAQLGTRGVLCDYRDNVLRLGPAPYLRDDQLTTAVQALDEVLRENS